jgi:hypothetical protein
LILLALGVDNVTLNAIAAELIARHPEVRGYPLALRKTPGRSGIRGAKS